MIISSDFFYQKEITGKSVEQIEKLIYELENEIRSLEIQLTCKREYLDRAKHELVAAKQRAIDFNNNIEFISKLQFCEGGFFGGHKEYTYTISGDQIYWSECFREMRRINTMDTRLPPNYSPKNKKELLDIFRTIHIGEWEHRYDDPDINDGTQWKLIIEYSNGRKPEEYYGSNAFPPNYDELQKLMGSCSIF